MSCREARIQARVARHSRPGGGVSMGPLDRRLEAKRSAPVEGFMFDLDGTLILSDRSLGGYRVLPGAVEVLCGVAGTRSHSFRRAHQRQRLSRRPSRRRSCARSACRSPTTHMLTPSSVAADLMPQAGVKRALVLGSRGVGHALAEAGIETVFTGEKTRRGCAGGLCRLASGLRHEGHRGRLQAIWTGAKLYVASDVPFFATSQRQDDGLLACDRRRRAQDHARSR